VRCAAGAGSTQCLIPVRTSVESTIAPRHRVEVGLLMGTPTGQVGLLKRIWRRMGRCGKGRTVRSVVYSRTRMRRQSRAGSDRPRSSWSICVPPPPDSTSTHVNPPTTHDSHALLVEFGVWWRKAIRDTASRSTTQILYRDNVTRTRVVCESAGVPSHDAFGRSVYVTAAYEPLGPALRRCACSLRVVWLRVCMMHDA